MKHRFIRLDQREVVALILIYRAFDARILEKQIAPTSATTTAQADKAVQIAVKLLRNIASTFSNTAPMPSRAPLVWRLLPLTTENTYPKLKRQ